MIKSARKTCNTTTPGKPTPVKHRLIELFWTLGPAFTRWAESHMQGQGLTPQRMRLMALLFENGTMMMSALRDELGVTATNVTALVDALEKDGMVVRRPHKTDRRATLIELTARAEKKLTENCSSFKDKVSEIFSPFSDKDQDLLLNYLIRIREELVERHILEESDLCPKSVKTKQKA